MDYNNTKVERTLTGKFHHRPNFWGSLVLWVQVEYWSPDDPPPTGYGELAWEKADDNDLAELNLKSNQE